MQESRILFLSVVVRVDLNWTNEAVEWAGSASVERTNRMVCLWQEFCE